MTEYIYSEQIECRERAINILGVVKALVAMFAVSDDLGRNVIELRIIKELSFRKIAQELNSSRSTVHRRWIKACDASKSVGQSPY